jgi:hypothetical protein
MRGDRGGDPRMHRLSVSLQADMRGDKIDCQIGRALRAFSLSPMSSACRKRGSFRVAGVFCVLQVGMALAPSLARGGCDYDVSSDTSRSRPLVISELIVPPSVTESAARLAPTGPMQGGRPCTGASCSRGGGLPATPSPPPRLRSELVCWTGAECTWSSSGLHRAVVELPPALSRHSTSPPERPPRGA